MLSKDYKKKKQVTLVTTIINNKNNHIHIAYKCSQTQNTHPHTKHTTILPIKKNAGEEIRRAKNTTQME